MSETTPLNDNELNNITAGVNTGVLTESERAKFRDLDGRANRAFHNPNASAIEFNNAVRNLTAFCREMKAKYGDIFGYRG